MNAGRGRELPRHVALLKILMPPLSRHSARELRSSPSFGMAPAQHAQWPQGCLRTPSTSRGTLVAPQSLERLLLAQSVPARAAQRSSLGADAARSRCLASPGPDASASRQAPNSLRHPAGSERPHSRPLPPRRRPGNGGEGLRCRALGVDAPGARAAEQEQARGIAGDGASDLDSLGALRDPEEPSRVFRDMDAATAYRIGVAFSEGFRPLYDGPAKARDARAYLEELAEEYARDPAGFILREARERRRRDASPPWLLQAVLGFLRDAEAGKVRQRARGNAVELETSPSTDLDSKSVGSTDVAIAGTEYEVLLQGFNWESHRCRNPSWWLRLAALAQEIAGLGITSVWLPPPSRSLAPQGYIPQDLYCLDSEYGSEGDLRHLLYRLKEANVRAVADLVVNHRGASAQDEQGKWTRFSGLRPEWDEYAVTSDTGGKGAASTGMLFNGVANVDHTQDFVQRDLKAWIRWLRYDLGFACLRFDFAKGYSVDIARAYLEAGAPEYAIGEFWDTCNYVGPDHALDYNQDSHRQRIVDWIDGTGGQAVAFDFTTKAILQEAVRSKEWERLRDRRGRAAGLLGLWSSRAVTFVDNHDTGSTQAHWPFPPDRVLQGYAYILTHPGIPCIFYDHIFEWGGDVRHAICSLLECRRKAQVACNSPMEILKADKESYVAKVGPNLLVQIGAADWNPEQGNGRPFELACRGPDSCQYAVWIRRQ